MVHQGLVAVTLAICCLHFAAGSSCTKMSKMLECFPAIRTYMERPVNLSVVLRAAGGSDGMDNRCRQFNTVIECYDGKIRDCTSFTDSTEQNVVFWENARVGVDYMCNAHHEEFVKHKTCLSSDATRTAALACDVADDSHSRRKRHSCADYEKEILCTDAALTKQCGSEAARHVGQLARIFLKNTAHTKSCNAPAFKATSGAAALFSSAFILGIGLVTAKLLLLV